MSLTNNSLFLRWLLPLWELLQTGWQDSRLGNGCRALSRSAAHSQLFHVIWREGVLTRVWPTSLACHTVSMLINLPCALIRWIYQKCRRIWEGSLTLRATGAAGGAGFACLGLFMLVMLVVPHENWNNLYGLVGALVLLALFILGCANRPRLRLEPARLGPYMLFYGMMICCGFAVSLSPSLSLRFFLFHITSFLLVLLAVSSVRKYEQFQLVAVLIVTGITIAALYGCWQGYVGVDIVPSQQDLSVNAGMPGRVYSFFDNPNNFAELLVMAVPLDFALLGNARTFRGKLLALLTLIPCVAAIGLTYSRSGWIGLALATLIFLAFQNWRFVPALLVLGVCAVPFLPETIYNRILTIGNTKDSSTQYRFAIYDASRYLLHDFWLQGVGLGSDVMGQVFRRYPSLSNGAYPIHTHNNYLQMWGETGILGAISYLALLGWRLKTGVKGILAASDRRVKRLLAAALSGFCGILVISVAEYTWFYARNMFLFWVLFGLIGAGVKLARVVQPEGHELHRGARQRK